MCQRLYFTGVEDAVPADQSESSAEPAAEPVDMAQSIEDLKTEIKKLAAKHVDTTSKVLALVALQTTRDKLREAYRQMIKATKTVKDIKAQLERDREEAGEEAGEISTSQQTTDLSPLYRVRI